MWEKFESGQSEDSFYEDISDAFKQTNNKNGRNRGEGEQELEVIMIDSDTEERYNEEPKHNHHYYEELLEYEPEDEENESESGPNLGKFVEPDNSDDDDYQGEKLTSNHQPARITRSQTLMSSPRTPVTRGNSMIAVSSPGKTFVSTPFSSLSENQRLSPSTSLGKRPAYSGLRTCTDQKPAKRRKQNRRGQR
ncbi:hypothetical protein TWF694_009543 [Orbilia ellipsospora]|uniref:Uncharacterized protein n=1 Tax=Orbilia ellipsospora TaxID=2528407 RepID=A0AAV9XDT6_9PEZI